MGLILQALEVLVVLAFGALLLVVIIGVFLLFVGFLGIIWLLIVYFFSYRPVVDGRFEQARTPTLLVAILSLLTVNLLSGILYLIAYVKLGDAVREMQTVSMPPPGFPQAPLQTQPARVCLGCGRVLQTPTPAFCPACGKQVPA